MKDYTPKILLAHGYGDAADCFFTIGTMIEEMGDEFQGAESIDLSWSPSLDRWMLSVELVPDDDFYEDG